MFKSAGSPVIVTGAAGGIGAACVARFAAAGHPVAALDLVEAEAATGVRPFVVDVTDAAAMHEVAAQVRAQLGAVGVVVCAAGVLHAGDLLGQDPAQVRHMMGVNHGGVLHTLQAFGPDLVATRGCAVTVASNAAGVPRRALGAYGASKAAATSLTLSFGLELAEHGVRCNVVQPGSTETQMLHALWGDGDDAHRAGRDATIRGDLERFRLGIPLGRIADPTHIAGVVAALCGPDFAHVTLQEIYVDGGASLHA